MAHVLVVGDDKERIRGLKDLLALDGHFVRTLRDVERWREQERASGADLVVAAVPAPGALLASAPPASRGFAPPILFVHRETDPATRSHVDDRLIDWIVSPFAAEDMLARVDALDRVRRLVMHVRGGAGPSGAAPAPVRSWRWLAALWRARVPRCAKPVSMYCEVASRVAQWNDLRDGFAPGHAERVTELSAMIAGALHVPDEETAALVRAAMLHDIGKVALPLDVLRQRRPLEENQLRLVRTHAERGAAILRALEQDDTTAETILNHHEYLDGSGYRGCKGDAISRASRVLAVAEGYDAMTTSLVRERVTAEDALGAMQDGRGTRWDPDCVDALIAVMRPKPNVIALR